MQISPISYKNTIRACHLGNITMAAISSFLPLIFVTLRNEFGFSYSKLGLLVLVNFTTQVAVDFSVSAFVDKYGFRRFIVASTVLTVIGFSLFAAAPLLSDRPYPIFVIAAIIFSGSCGLLELLLSPIVNSIPTDEKAKAMSLLHAFYCWGVILVVLVSTVLLRVLGSGKWQLIMMLWTIVPIIDFFMFLKVPLAPPVPAEKRTNFKKFDNKPLYILLCVTILCGAAAELAMGQWTSTFIEKAMGVSKLVGDTLGVCGFAAMMGIGRVYLGRQGEKPGFNINRVLLISCAVATVCYITVAVSGSNIITLIACAVTGLAVSTLWPGSLISATNAFPLAGAWMFAVLSGFGDMGGALAPWLMGKITDAVSTASFAVQLCVRTGLSAEQLALKTGMLLSAVFPLIGFVVMIFVIKKSAKTKFFSNS